MPDFEQVEQIAKLAELMASMPPQQEGGPRIPFAIPQFRVKWATELVRDYGVRVHTDLARKEIVTEKAPTVGQAKMSANFAQRRAVDKIDAQFLLDLLRSTGDVPALQALADEIQAVLGDPVRERQLLNRIADQNPDLIATARQLQDQAPPDMQVPPHQ